MQGEMLYAEALPQFWESGARHACMQGDVLCAEALNQILVTKDGQSRLLAAFIHRVVPLHETVSTFRSSRSNKSSWLATWQERNIWMLRTHVGMAVQVDPLLQHALCP